MDPRRTTLLMLAVLTASQANAQPVAAPQPATGSARAPGPQVSAARAASLKRVFLPPPLQWDGTMLNARPALRQSAADLAGLTGGIAFGMSPQEVNARLPNPYSGLSWEALPAATEYPGDVRYFGVPIARSGALHIAGAACLGDASYVVFLFNTRGLFRLSYRLVADNGCVDTDTAAQMIFARYVPIGQSVALSMRYRAGNTDVVDLTDPTAGSLILTRWRPET
ncbi:MAG TPA: hypothetical protein VGC09_23205 [Rhodopila sp.]